jgi:hypothetical protein
MCPALGRAAAEGQGARAAAKGMISLRKTGDFTGFTIKIHQTQVISERTNW